MGVLDAVVLGAVRTSPPADEGEGDLTSRRLTFHPEQPFHLAPDDSLPLEAPPPTNFFAGVVRADLGEGRRLGATFTAATPLSSRCSGAAPDGASCVPRGGQAAAVDFSLRSGDGAYVVLGQVDGSRVTGGQPEGTLLRDGTLLRPGDAGFGMYARGGKLGGEPWRLALAYEYASPRLDLNATGFQPLQNFQEGSAHLQYGRGSDWGIFHELWMGVKGVADWSADGRGTGLRQALSLTVEGVLPGFSQFACESGGERGRKDLREIPQRGIPFQRPSFLYAFCELETDGTRLFALSTSGYVDHSFASGPSPGRVGKSVSADVTWRPSPGSRRSWASRTRRRRTGRAGLMRRARGGWSSRSCSRTSSR